jgi:hypothetical protein
MKILQKGSPQPSVAWKNPSNHLRHPPRGFAMKISIDARLPEVHFFRVFQ